MTSSHRLQRLCTLLLALLVPVGAAAQPLAITVGSKSDSSGYVLHVMNVANGHTTATMALGLAAGPARTALSPNGELVFVSLGDRLVRVRIGTGAVEPIAISGPLTDIALNPDGSRLYAATADATIVALDAASGAAVSAPLVLPGRARRLVLSRATGRLFALSDTTASVTVIDPATWTIERTIATDPAPVELVPHPDGTRLYVAHSTLATATTDGDSVAAYDVTSGQLLGRNIFPDNRTSSSYWPGPVIVYAASVAGQPAISSDGRLYVPRRSVSAQKGGSYYYSEVVEVLDVASLASVTRVTISPQGGGSIWPGVIAAGAIPGSPDVLVTSANGTRRINSQTWTASMLAAGVEGVKAFSVGAAPSCWFEVPGGPITFGEAGGVAQLTIPTPPTGCTWTATPSRPDWISVTPESGTSGGPVTVIVSPTGFGRSGTITIGGQAISVTQRVARMFIDQPLDGQTLVGVVPVLGWALNSDGLADTTLGAGIAEVVLYDETPGSPVRLVARGEVGLFRPDLMPVFGPRYAFAGYRILIPALALPPGSRQLVVRARLSVDNSWISAGRRVVSGRDPILSFGVDNASPTPEPGSPRLTLAGWAYDERPASGCGVSDVTLSAIPEGGSTALPLGRATLGVERADVAQSLAFATPFPCGWRLTFDHPPADRYTVRADIRDSNGTLVHTLTKTVTFARGPFGVVDTPINGSQVSGAIAITGWALDDVGVSRVDVVYGSNTIIARATFVDGVRPDVAAAYPTFPGNTRGGWGVQVLTNMLPNQGTGTLRFTVIAYDNANNGTTLGTVSVTGANSSSSLPFGTIDQPAQGATVSGTIPIFGWALTAPPAIIPEDGSTIEVLIDGRVIGRPVFGQCRGTNGTNFPPVGTCNDDIATAFGATYRNLAEGRGAIGSFLLDTTTLTNGLHELQWRVTDSLGNTQGIGSRYIYVDNR